MPLPDGWSYFLPLPSSLQSMGYYAGSFINTADPDHIIIEIAERGTTPSIWDYFEDFVIAAGEVPYLYYNEALPYTEMVRKYAESKYPPNSIEYRYTGHSLGAILVELLSATWRTNYDYHRRDIVFESPGSKPIVEKMIQEQELPNDALTNVRTSVTHIFAESNAINTCNSQIHTDSEIFLSYFPQNLSSIPLSNMGSAGYIYYFKDYTLLQHKIDNFYNYLHNHTDYYPSTYLDWPVGFAAGYKDYLDYYTHHDYWLAYMSYLWEHNLELRNKYQGNYESFTADFTNTLFKQQNFLNQIKNHRTTEKKQTELDKMILEHALPITPITSGKRPALYDVINNNYDGHADIRRQLYAYANNDKKLYWAVMCGDINFAEQLIQQTHANVNTQHGAGHFSLLQIAIRFGYLDMVNFLLKHHAKPNLKNTYGNTALHTVANTRYTDAYKYAKVLIVAGADPKAKNNNGQTPLMLMYKHSSHYVASFMSAITSFKTINSI